MNSAELSAQVLKNLEITNEQFKPPTIGEKQKRNTSNVMKEISLQRLQANGQPLIRQRGSRYLWGEGIILNRNSRVGGNGFWSNITPSQIQDLKQVTVKHPAVFLLCFFEVANGKIHVWAIPDEVAIRALDTIPENKTGAKTMFIEVGVDRFSHAVDCPDLTPYYREILLCVPEHEALVSSVKQDAAAKELAADIVDSEDDEDSTGDLDLSEIYTQQTVDFLISLPEHVNDKAWHDRTSDAYIRLLRNPTNALVERLREDTVGELDSKVAATTRNTSVLKKNDYGRGGYHDHYWAAFYDPAAKSKTRSCQLFFRMLGRQKQFRYGLAFGNYCDDYIANLHVAISADRGAVQEYLSTAPTGVVVEIGTSDDEDQIDIHEFADQIGEGGNDKDFPIVTSTTPMRIIRTFPLEELPKHVETLASEIGELFRWVWPFFK